MHVYDTIFVFDTLIKSQHQSKHLHIFLSVLSPDAGRLIAVNIICNRVLKRVSELSWMHDIVLRSVLVISQEILALSVDGGRGLVVRSD